MNSNAEDFPVREATSATSDHLMLSPDHSSEVCSAPADRKTISFDSTSTNNLKKMNFKICPYYPEAMSVMYDLFKSQKLTDVCLRVNTKRLTCHRVVLASASPYFRAMFTNEMKEASMHEVELHGLSESALQTLVEFAYTGHVELDESNVCELLVASSMIQMTHVVTACCEFLERQFHPSNIIGILNFATSNDCLHLSRAAQLFLDQNFNDVVKYDEFIALSSEHLIRIIMRDNLSVRTEAEVFNAVIRWVNHDQTNRIGSLEDALSAVRCHNLSPTFIRNQVKNCSLLATVPSAKAHLQLVLRDLTEHRHVPIRKRTAGFSEVLYSAGGYLRYSLSVFECYNPLTGRWKQLADIPSPRSGLSACSVRGCVYLVGGRNNNEQGNLDASHVDCYDPITDRWHSCAPLSVPRNRVAVGVIDDMIYAIGGSTNTLPHNSCESYDTDLDRWTPIASMRHRRIGLGVAVLDRLLYAVGGFDGECRLNTVERYDPENDSWEDLSPLNRARSGAGVIALGQFIYAVGGYDSCSQLRTVECYNPEQNRWEYRAPMLHPRSALSATVLGNEIWVFGGYDGNEFLSSVESYNPTTDQWTERTFMDCGKSGHAIVANREPPTHLSST